MSDVMNKSDQNEANQKPVILRASPAHDFKNRQYKSLSIKEYQELKAKNRSTLSEHQLKQLEAVDKQLQEVAKTVSSRIDFAKLTSIAKMAQVATPKIPNVHKDLLRSINAAHSSILARSAYSPGQLSVLITAQNNLLKTTLATSRLNELVNTALATRTMFADFQTFHRRVVRSLDVNLGSLSASLELSKTEKVDTKLQAASLTHAHVLTTDVEATQTNSASGLVLVDKADLSMIFEELQASREERAEIRRLLASGRSDKLDLITPATIFFKRAESTLQIGRYQISIVLNSKQAQFAKVITGSPENVTKKWDIEELAYEAFGERLGIDDSEPKYINRFRNYIHQLNLKITAASKGQIVDFFVFENLHVTVNQKYLDFNA